MIDYNIVSYCRKCNKRMVHKKGHGPVWYCPECKEKIDKARAKEAEERMKEAEEQAKKDKKK